MSTEAIELPAEARPKQGGFLDDFWNPILVKEIRQAMRGRWFQVVFLVAIAGLTLATVVGILSMEGNVSAWESKEFFGGVYFCLVVATCGLLPFGAFSSMGAEWDENTWDLLVLSNLRPRRILWGKLLSSWAQVGMFFTLFGPYLAFTFLLRGIDLLALVVILVCSLMWSLALCTAALSVSTYSRVRVGRVALMAIVAALLLPAVGGAMAIGVEFLENPEIFREREFYEGLVGVTLFLGFITALLFCSACNMLAHPEENRSTNVRVLATAAQLTGLGFVSYIMYRFGTPDMLCPPVIVILVFLCTVSMFFVTEPDRLGRRVALQVPRNSVVSNLVLPWLPGGGRGVAYLFLHLGLLMVFLVLTKSLWMSPGGERLLGSGVLAVFALSLYGLLYLLLPASLFAPFTRSPAARAAVRGSIPLLMLLFLVGPSIAGIFLGAPNLSSFEHPGNPAWLPIRVWESGELRLPTYWLLIGGLAGLGVLLSLPRIWQAVSEQGDARRKRLELEARRSGAAGVAPAEEARADAAS